MTNDTAEHGEHGDVRAGRELTRTSDEVGDGEQAGHQVSDCSDGAAEAERLEGVLQHDGEDDGSDGGSCGQ